MSKCWIMSTSKALDSRPYFTKGKWYEILKLSDTKKSGEFKDDSGYVGFTMFKDSAHLDGEDWQVHYGYTPPDSLQEPTSNNKALGDSEVASATNLPVNEIQDVTESAIELLEDIYYAYHADDDKFGNFLDKLKSGEYSVIHNTNTN